MTAAFWLVGCGAVTAYDRMQEENDRQALIHEYRLCVENHPNDSSSCDHITAGLSSASLTVHQPGN
jgi:hypothetical protein